MFLLRAFEVGFSCLPGLGYFDENGGDEAKERGLIGEEADDAGATFDLAVEGLASVGGPCFFTVDFGEREDGEAFGDIGFGQLGELGLGFAIGCDKGGEAGFGMCAVVGVEDSFDIGGNFAFELLFGDVLLRVLLKMKLATLPWSPAEAGFEGGSNSCVGVGGDEVGDAHAAFANAVEEVAPMHLGFGTERSERACLKGSPKGGRGGGQQRAQETPRTMRLPLSRRIPMAMRVEQSLTTPSIRTL